jgi:hypothetical protein
MSDRAASTVLADLTEALGADDAERLVAALGGVVLYVPRSPPGAHHPISVAVGTAAAARLSGAFGGEQLSVPVARRTRQRVLDLAGQRRSRRDIARAVGLTQRRVYQILAEPEPKAAPDLFG